jgi:hypothetical protein
MEGRAGEIGVGEGAASAAARGRAHSRARPSASCRRDARVVRSKGIPRATDKV